MAEPNPDHLVNLSNNLGLPLISVDRISIDDAGLRCVCIGCVEEEYDTRLVSFSSFANLQDDTVEVCVSAVESPNKFYLQLMATESQ